MKTTEPLRIAITIDDGPDGSGTAGYLALLKEFGLRATFFVVGQNVAQHGNQLTEMAALGCEIGNHSYTHGYLSELTAEALQIELAQTAEAVERFLPDLNMGLVRAPYFAYSQTMAETVPAPMIDASICAENNASSAEDVCANLVTASDGDVILLHSWSGSSLEGLRMAIPRLLERGCSFLTVSELFAAFGTKPVAGAVYRRAD